ncbi:MAG TPA: aldose epimerase family protein [Woeseiaceae bacterium]|nr:aldose epimerase family protein [Woeseiaceae bacterium]
MAGNFFRLAYRGSGLPIGIKGLSGSLAVAASLLLCSSPLPAADPGSSQDTPGVTQRHYGTLEDGSEVTLATLANGAGVEVDVLTYGGIITRLVTPDSAGRPGDIVLGLDSLEEYVSSSPYFGAIIGRYGNRIASGRFSLSGKEYQLSVNDGDNHLHGGEVGFDKKNWKMKPFVTANSAGVTLSLTSPDGDQGYPGRLYATVVYELTNDNELDLRFTARTDRPTIVNLTHHSYFNLAGEGSILDHELTIPAEHFTPVRQGLIPTGELREVAGTPFDFRDAKRIGRDIDEDNEQLELGLGYDHNWVLKDTVDDELILAARLAHPSSGRVLEVWSVEPGVQFYSGNFLDGTLEGKGITHGHRSGLCLEPQHFPDSPNQPRFPTTTVLPGETYESRIVYRFLTTR